MSSSLRLGIGRIGKKSVAIDGVSAGSLVSMRSHFAAARIPGVSDARERAQSKLLVKNAGIDKVRRCCSFFIFPFIFTPSASLPTLLLPRNEMTPPFCSKQRPCVMLRCLRGRGGAQLGMQTNFWLISSKNATMMTGRRRKLTHWQWQHRVMRLVSCAANWSSTQLIRACRLRLQGSSETLPYKCACALSSQACPVTDSDSAGAPSKTCRCEGS